MAGNEIPEGLKCFGETASGHRCKRNAKVVLRSEWEEKFLIFFTKKRECFYYYCNQHADKSGRERV